MAVKSFNEKLSSYNNIASLISVENLEGIPGKTESLKMENDDILSVGISVLKGNFSSKINKDIDTINSMMDKLDKSKSILIAINNPTSQWVENKLKNIEEIKDIKAVDENNDPNGFLGKEHGYTSCVYFTVKGLSIKGKDSIDPVVLGTDGGGCIEVYENLTDAKNRCDYLKQFDNTITYSGSYAIVGTMVVRTSYVLDTNQQYTLTDYIFKEFGN